LTEGEVRNVVSALLEQGFKRYAWDGAQQAYAYFEEALRLDPKCGNAFYGRGLCHHATGNLDDAIADYDLAVSLDSKLSRAHLNRGLLRLHRGKTEESMSDFDAVMALEPEDTVGFKYRASLWNGRGDPAKALSDLDQAIRLDEEDADLYFQRACLHQELGQHDPALCDLDQAIHGRLFEPKAAGSSGRRERYSLDSVTYSQAEAAKCSEAGKRRLCTEHFSGRPEGMMRWRSRRYLSIILSYMRLQDLKVAWFGF